MTASTCGLQKEEWCLTSTLDGLQRCSTSMSHTTTSSGCRVLMVKFCWLESIVRSSVDKMTSKLSPLTGVFDSSRLQLLKKKRLFLRVQVFRFIFFNSAEEKRPSAKTLQMTLAPIQAFSVSTRHGSLQCKGRVGRELLFAPLRILHPISSISLKRNFFCMWRFFCLAQNDLFNR